MDLQTFAHNMWPFWVLGLSVMLAVILAGQKHLLRVEKKPLKQWIMFLTAVTLWRILLFKLTHMSGIGESVKPVTMLPWPVAFTVFWEDACHGLPLVILKQLLGNGKWAKPINWFFMIAVMVEFGLGHMYQGVFAAALLSLYVPYTAKKGEQYGFGTIMICHVLYDLATLLFLKYLVAA